MAANITDSTGWYGPETWYRDGKGNYFMCTRMEFEACHEYSIFFLFSNGTWAPRVGASSKCSAGS